MAITSRGKAAAFFIVLGACSAAVAIALNITWVIHWREVGMIILGLIFFGFIIAALTLNTIFLVREIRRNEQHNAFINAVTHELKTPIASIRLYLETLQSRKTLGEEQRAKFYQVMLDDTDRLLHTVEQVLRAGQVTHEGAQHWQPVDIGELAAECAELTRVRHRLEHSAIRVNNRAVGVEETKINGDSEELRTAITNVLDNAVKYSKDGYIDITMELAAEGKDVLLRVTDQGVGIARGELKRVFRRFYRAPERLASRVKGTGLGLFLVRTIVKRHGGRAEAYSEGEGKGTTITIRLPRLQR